MVVVWSVRKRGVLGEKMIAEASSEDQMALTHEGPRSVTLQNRPQKNEYIL